MFIVRFGPFLLNEAARTLTRDEAEVHLTPKAFDLLVILAAEAPRVVPKGELHARVWPGTFVSDATLIGVVKELRRVLDDANGRVSCIRTAHRVGYAFGQPLEIERAEGASGWHWIVMNGRHAVLRAGENRIGRDPASAVWLDSAGVSRIHARIVIVGPRVTIEDLGSKNGTKVDGAAVSGTTMLSDGDRIEIGTETLIYRCSTAGLSTETIPARHPTSRRVRDQRRG